MRVPTLLLIGEQEVISDAARALERAHRLMPNFEGGLVPGCRHDMCASRHGIVDARVLEFLEKAPIDDRGATATARQSVA
jgi:pimeloyl-ACP methyl ester carboxylesterase